MSIDIVGSNGDLRRLDGAAIDSLRGQLRGALLAAGDAGYDQARRIWNAMIDKRPALVARCSGDADVMRVVRFAADNELLLSVKGGGHNVAGSAVCEGGLMIDLSPMKGVRIDAVRRVAHAQSGLLWQ
jgi:FAD/FMN-containing dehydrogenase